MTPLLEKDKPVRLEDFITLAKEGKKVEVEIELKKMRVTQKVHPDETEDMSDELESYLLTGDYMFRVEGESWKVSKVYVMGLAGESMNTAMLNKNIANDRLKMDYQRLKDVNIEFEDKYF
jgi:vacuolar-type H+-ATPase subunit D/Vma8